MNPQVSVIIPVYNVAAFVKKCTESLCQQTLKNFELIFVNDASTDNSISIVKQTLNEFQSDNFTVQIIEHQQNSGVVQARKTGLENAHGNYILFVDSDDFLEPDMLETMFKRAVVTKADIVTSDMCLDYMNDCQYFNEYLSDDASSHFSDIAFGNYFAHSLCNKLVRSELYDRSFAQLGYNMTYYEDKFIAIRIYFYAQKIVKVNRALYHYVKYNQSSATQTVNEKTYQSIIYYWKSLEEFLSTENAAKKYENQIAFNKTKDFLKLIFGTNKAQLIRKYTKLFDEADQLSIQYLRKGEKLLLFCVRHNLIIFTLIIRKLIILKNK